MNKIDIIRAEFHRLARITFEECKTKKNYLTVQKGTTMWRFYIPIFSAFPNVNPDWLSSLIADNGAKWLKEIDMDKIIP